MQCVDNKKSSYHDNRDTLIRIGVVFFSFPTIYGHGHKQGIHLSQHPPPYPILRRFLKAVFEEVVDSYDVGLKDGAGGG